jgi:hypothetical protein
MAAAYCSKGNQRFNQSGSLCLYRQELYSVRTRWTFDLQSITALCCLMLVGCSELLIGYKIRIADPGGLAALGLVLRPFTCWVYGFGSCRGLGCLSVVSVVCCQVEVSATNWSLAQRSPTVCMCVSLSVIRCKNNPLHLQWVVRRSQTKKEESSDVGHYFHNYFHNSQFKLMLFISI